ncbi:MAG: hypothetical protein ABJA60_07270 [Nitrosospira sp.]
MSDSLYDTSAESASEIPLKVPAACVFFRVSLFKLTIMSLFTLGLYEIYWCYRNWQLVKAHETLRILPFARAFFTIFFCYQFFVWVRKAGLRQKNSQPLAPGALAVGWIAFYFIGGLPDPYWVISLLKVFFLLPVQARINHINAIQAPTLDINSHFSPWNWVVIVVGAILFIFAIIESFSPDPHIIEAGPFLQAGLVQKEAA